MRPHSSVGDGWNSVSWGNGTQPQEPDAAEEEARQKRAKRMQRLALADSCVKAPGGPEKQTPGRV